MQVHPIKIGEYAGHSGSVYAMQLSHDARWLFSAGDDGVVARWDLHSSALDGQALLRTERAVYALLPLDEYVLLVGTADGTVYRVNLKSQQAERAIKLHTEPVYAFWHDVARKRVGIFHAKGRLTFVSEDLQQVLHEVVLAENHLRAVCAAQQPEQLYIGSSDNAIVHYHLPTDTVAERWTAHGNSVFSLMVHPQGQYLASGGRDAFLNIWDIRQQHLQREAIPAHNFTVNDIQLAHEGDVFATASRDKSIKIWDAYSFTLLKVIDVARYQGHTHSVNRLRWLPDNTLLSCGDDRRIIRWQIFE